MHHEARIHRTGRVAWKTVGVLSVCTAALLLAEAGLFGNRAATPHQGAIDLLRRVGLMATIREAVRFLDNGKVVTSAGIDAAVHAVGKLLGHERAERTARHMEYPWQPVAP